MARRLFCWALLIFQALWLNVIVPGHQRGIVQLPGSRASTPSASSCPFCGPDSHARPTNHSPVGNPGTCAICFFAAHLDIPPAINWSLPPLCLLGSVADEFPDRLIARICLIPFDGRGPPSFS